MATRLSMGRFVQIMTGRRGASDDDTPDPKTAAKKAAAMKSQIEANLAAAKADAARATARGLSYPGMDTATDFEETGLADALKVQDAKQQLGELETLVIQSAGTRDSVRTAVDKLLDQDATFDDRAKSLQQQIDAYGRQKVQFSRPDLQALFANDPMAAPRKELAALLSPSDPRDRMQRIKDLGTLENRVSAVCRVPELAAQFEAAAYDASVALHAKKEEAQYLPSRATRDYADKQLAALTDRFDALNKVTGPVGLDQPTNKLRALLAEVNSLDLAVSPASGHRRERLDGQLKALKTAAGGAPASVAPAVATTLADLRERVDRATVGRGPDDKAVEVRVGKSRVTLGGDELLRGLERGLKGFETALADPKSRERELLELEGPDKLVDNLVAIHTQLVAYGQAPPPELSPAELYAIRRYTSQDYKAMNAQRLGTGQDKRAKVFNEICDQALEKLPPYPKAAWPVFRLERAWSQEVVDKRYRKGNTFTAGILWSTGARGSADVSSSSNEGPKLVHTIFGKSGRDIAALSEKPGEGSEDQGGAKISKRKAARRDVASGKGEVLFPASATFNVSGRKDPAGGKAMLVYDSNYQGAEPIMTRLKEI